MRKVHFPREQARASTRPGGCGAIATRAAIARINQSLEPWGHDRKLVTRAAFGTFFASRRGEGGLARSGLLRPDDGRPLFVDAARSSRRKGDEDRDGALARSYSASGPQGSTLGRKMNRRPVLGNSRLDSRSRLRGGTR